MASETETLIGSVTRDFPFVSIIVPMFNEERYIEKCIESILENDYPRDRMEVLIVDGRSTDRSREIVLEYAKRYPLIRLLDNPKRIIPAALNTGIREASGEIVIRMDAHAVYAPDYISQCVNVLQETGAVNVGGVQRGIGVSYVSKAVATATRNRFGCGNAKFRYSEREEEVDTVYLGTWWRKNLEEIGGFDEDWLVNEDYELNYRLRKAGGKILLSPKIRCQYYVRVSLRALARQYFRYGFWKVKTLLAHPQSAQWRQIVPPMFVLGLVSSLALLPVYWPAAIVVPGLYAVANLSASLLAVRKHGWKYLPVLPVVFLMLHISWGMGFWVGAARFGVPHFFSRVFPKTLR